MHKMSRFLDWLLLVCDNMVYIYICVYVYMYVCIYMYIHTHTCRDNSLPSLIPLAVDHNVLHRGFE
jgi:hypothetical protein